ncbi:MAG: PaaI family thioesterase [Paraburkholderia sp.]|uniref:PaaI family thioesterase n=1 Tax=Paraburkholderia sp. TaxID=1926495 RepID=UPI003C5E8BEE
MSDLLKGGGGQPGGGDHQADHPGDVQPGAAQSGPSNTDPTAASNALPVLESPFVDSLGVQLVSAADGASEVILPLASNHMNTWAVAHGGVTMTLADVALAMAARSLAGNGVGVVTVEMKVNFMQPGRGELRATARVLHRSTTMAYCEGEIRDSEGHFVAKALGTFKYMRRLAVGREVTQQRLRSDPSAQPGPSDG